MDLFQGSLGMKHSLGTRTSPGVSECNTHRNCIAKYLHVLKLPGTRSCVALCSWRSTAVQLPQKWDTDSQCLL